ncbi:MAG: phenylalanine--tRNA ligase subunit beta [Clostridia bacterium]|nr:phenylalanine--tRNA ligase subunit beta [Clostridia bacterium]
MLVPVKWLKDFVDINISIPELADKLVSCGFEIEAVINQADAVKGVKTCKILSVEQHPNADKLIVCKIDLADGVERQIVTNNKWLQAGDIVPVALEGAKLFSGMEIHEGALRGVHSNGMFCGGSELNLTEADYKGAGEDKVLKLLDNTPIGKDINEVMGTDDVILDVGITANRTDANSILGIAREVAAVTGQTLKMPKDYADMPVGDDINSYIKVENLATDLCPRYLAGMLTDVVVTESPEYIKRRLKSSGLRPINNIVDVTNYVLLEVGQPMHAFDLRTIKGNKIVVRRAEKGEKIVALDDKTYTLDTDNLAICNEAEPMAIAGVMGGANYSIFDDTNVVILESARFARDNIRRTSRTLGLRSDSSARFEKGIDFISQEYGLRKAIGMIVENGWGKVVAGTVDSYPVKAKQLEIDFTAKDVNHILGIEVEQQRMVDILNSLTLTTTVDGDKMHTVIPGYREDIVGVNDIAEEVIRMYGYDAIQTSLMPDAEMTAGGKTKKQENADKIKNILVGKGAYEICTYSFVSPKAWDMLHLEEDSVLRRNVKLLSPLGEDYSVMRTTLAHSMIKTMATNILRGNKQGRFFEVAKTYLPYELPLTRLPKEENVLAIGAFGEKENFYTFKYIIEDLLSALRISVKFKATDIAYMHPYRTANIVASDGTVIGYLGEVKYDVAKEYDVDKRMYIAEINEEYIEDNALSFDNFKVVSKFQAMERDLALVCDLTLEADTLLETVVGACSNLLIDARVFDVYKGEALTKNGKMSVAIKLTFQASDRTLKDGDVNKEIDNVLAALKENLGIVLR